MSDLFSAIVGAFLGAITAGGITWWVNREATKIQNTLALLTEWHSSDMQTSRDQAEQALGRRKSSDFLAAMAAADADRKISDEEIVASQDPAALEKRRNTGQMDVHALSRVGHFLQRVEILFRLDHLKREVVRQTFREIVGWWTGSLIGNLDVAADPGEWRRMLVSIRDLNVKLAGAGKRQA